MNLSVCTHTNEFRVKVFHDSTCITLIQRTDPLHFIIGEGKIPDIEILLDSFRMGGFGDHHYSALDVPSKHHLPHCLSVCRSNLQKEPLMERAISAAAKRRPCFRNDIVLFHSSQCVLLREIRVKLHLIHHGLDLDSFAEIRKDVRIEVGQRR